MDVSRILSLSFEDVVQRYCARDTMLYALGLGLGADPMDERELRFVYEKSLVALPTMAVVLGSPGNWRADPALGIVGPKVLHAAMEVELDRPLPAEATVRAREKIIAIVDKGKEKGALVVVERKIADHENGAPLGRLVSTIMLRGNGGIGVSVGEVPPPHRLPDRKPDRVVEIPTLPRQALIYRLSGDYNPLHAEPVLARSVGFERPILHGLCSFGIAVSSLLRDWCDYDASCVRRTGVRWTAPIIPGETLCVESWGDSKTLSFRVHVKERAIKALDHGVVALF
jgi:acyl dehydratase